MIKSPKNYNLTLKSYINFLCFSNRNPSYKNFRRLTTLIFLKTVVFFFTFVNPLNAQVKNSVYSMFGIGQLNDNSFGINKSLGGTGIAFQSGRSINYLNPASYLGIFPNSFNMEIGAYSIYNKSENKSTAQTDRDINFSYFSASFYFADWWASSFGIVPFSSVDYEINSTDEIGGEITSLEKNFKGSGGLNRIYWGNSFKVYEGLSVGLNASYIFGPITQTETAESNSNFLGYELKNERTAQSFYLDYGMQYSINSNDWLYTVGFIYGASKKLTTTDEIEFTYSGVTSQLEKEELLNIKIPRKFGIGIAVKKNNNFRAGFDYELGTWSNINFSNPNLDTKNSNRFSIGIEYSPGEDRTDESWFRGFFYRLGANYKNSYLKIDNTPINSMGISLGIGIPYDKINTINLTLEYGEEGTLNKGLIKNKYWMLYTNISFYELWSTLIPR